MLSVGAIFMGTALTVRALIGERAIFRREQAVGLSTTAYLLAKIAVFTVFAIIQSVIVVTITVLGRAGARVPSTRRLPERRTTELFVDIAATCGRGHDGAGAVRRWPAGE